MSLRTTSAVRIGFFDSGIGGMSVSTEFLKLRPSADVLYVADWQWCPYGRLPETRIIERARCITQKLIKHGCSAVVVACNTATAAAIDTLRAEFDIPFVGMEPAVKPAASISKSGVVGVLATQRTLDGRFFRSTSARCGGNTRFVTRVGEGFVELVESGDFESDLAFTVVKRSVRPIVEAGADQIVLGCTHYSFLKKLIQKAAGPNIGVVDPAGAVAAHAARIYDSLLSAVNP